MKAVVSDDELELQSIYNMIPGFKCQGCHRCCGAIRWNQAEDKIIREYLKEFDIPVMTRTLTDFFKKGLLCPYLSLPQGKCMIYPVRPFICRMQGHTKKLMCFYKTRPDLSLQKQDMISRRYKKLCRIECSTVLVTKEDVELMKKEEARKP